ncbi:hypothetical protein [Neobacillus mesonae]|nr:hypothetical protein [Neobacillus mesonae]
MGFPTSALLIIALTGALVELEEQGIFLLQVTEQVCIKGIT